MALDFIELHILLEIKRLKRENKLLRLWAKRDTPRCCVCGKPVKGLSVQRMLRPFIWDTRKCFEWKPRKIVSLEHQYGMDILDILKETSRRFGSLKPQIDALGISVPYFVSIVKKYSKQGYIEFMAKHTQGKRRKTYLAKLRSR